VARKLPAILRAQRRPIGREAARPERGWRPILRQRPSQPYRPSRLDRIVNRFMLAMLALLALVFAGQMYGTGAGAIDWLSIAAHLLASGKPF
jgi:hypothetical protein